MGCAKGDDANGATAQGKAVSSERKMRPRSGLLAPHVCFGALWHPRFRFAGALGPRSGEPLHCAPWHRSPGYDLRRAPYDHPDFISNALSENLFSASSNGQHAPNPFQGRWMRTKRRRKRLPRMMKRQADPGPDGGTGPAPAAFNVFDTGRSIRNK
ncbi:MAG: hypothetical protein BGO99_04020 [Nitrosospira sp. 56-18]|nr:MAG: hypothetical protein BGO99_04020 [Nitrosospira sp. 56-18]